VWEVLVVAAALASDPELLWLRVRGGRLESGECDDVGDRGKVDVFSRPMKKEFP
jgi:hypothetical protein